MKLKITLGFFLTRANKYEQIINFFSPNTRPTFTHYSQSIHIYYSTHPAHRLQFVHKSVTKKTFFSFSIVIQLRHSKGNHNTTKER